MSYSRTLDSPANGGGATPPTAVLSPPTSTDRDRLQGLVDQAASFHVFAIPESNQAPAVREGQGTTEIRQRLKLHRFDIALDGPSPDGVRGLNTSAEEVGTLDIQWVVIPYDFPAAPGRRPPPTPLNPNITQRFVMNEATFTFSRGADGFRSFGTGRTFPMTSDGNPKLVAAAIGIFMEGFGKFSGLEGNFTLCGDLTEEQGFTGHIMIRAVDQDDVLAANSEIPPPVAAADVDRGATYLTWIGRKGEEPDQENTFSMGQDGQVRGLNIPVHSKRVSASFATGTPGFRVQPLDVTDTVGREIGFGRGSVPGASPSGSTLNPFLFEGVSLYSFYDSAGNTVGTLTANVIEGRRFDVQLKRAPQEPALRFGFFGPVIFGSGCFKGAQGMLYGASGSVFKLPPEAHVISNWYVLRLLDPHGRYRAF